MRWTGARVLYRAALQWDEHNASQMGAALAYYTLFSVAPLLLIAVTIASFFFGSQVTRARVDAQLTQLMGRDIAKAVETLLDQVVTPQGGIWASLIGFVVMFFGALGVFVHLRNALFTIWKLPPLSCNTWLGMLFNYLLAGAMVLLVGLLVLLSVAANTAVAVLTELLEKDVTNHGVPWELIEFVVSVCYLTLLFMLVYRVMSGNRVYWRDIAVGAPLAALLFTIGKTLFGFYLAYTSTTSAYGAAGSLVAFLIWVYYSAQIMFFGAEVIQAWRTRHEWLATKTAEDTHVLA